MDQGDKAQDGINEMHKDDHREEHDHLLQERALENDVKSSRESLSQNNNVQIEIKRPIFNQTAFDERYEKENNPQLSALEKIKKTCSALHCSKDDVKKRALKLFPCVNILRNYKWKSWILSDIIAGLCVGAIHIPQCMGFSLLTSLPPVYGLYSTIFPLLLYFIFGTSRHISMGTMAIISIMISTVIEREVGKLPSGTFLQQSAPVVILDQPQIALLPGNATYDATDENVTTYQGQGNSTTDDNLQDLVNFKVGIAVSVTFIAGVIQILMSIFKLDIVATFMSMSFNGGFMTGAAFHIITSQVPSCLGIKIPGQSGLFRLPKIWYWILRSIPQANPPTVIISLISMLFLFICKEIINVRFKSKMKMPIPAELILVVIATVVSYFGNLNGNFKVQIIEDIPTGFPPPKLPSFHNAETYIVDCFIIAVVSFAISISLAKIFSQKYHYHIDQKQELLALGIMHTVTSFFHGFAGAQGPPRTLVHDGTGGKTQLAGVVSALLVLSVVLFIGPLFEALPNCILGSVIVIALLPLIKRFQDLLYYWKVNKNDFTVWLITWFCVVFLNIDMGLWIGLATSLLSVILGHNRAKGRLLGKAEGTELYTNIKSYKGVKETSQSNIFIFNFDSPLYFANVDTFKKELFKKTINPDTLLKQENNALEKVLIEKSVSIDNESEKGSQILNNNERTPEEESKEHTLKSTDSIPTKASFLLAHKQYDYLFEKKKPPTPVEMKILSQIHESTRNGTIVLDCSAISYIDVMGLNLLKTISTAYKNVCVELTFANCSLTLLSKMETHGFDISTNVYPSIQDAVKMTQERRMFHDNI